MRYCNFSVYTFSIKNLCLYNRTKQSYLFSDTQVSPFWYINKRLSVISRIPLRTLMIKTAQFQRWIIFQITGLFLGQTSHLQRPKKKIDFSFIWLNWIQTFNLTFPQNYFQKSLKAPELFRKTYFQIKVNKSGRCHNLARAPGWIPRGNCSCLGSIFMFIPYFVYIAHFTKFTRGIYLLMKKSKAKESPW